jgi:hypothetical protein
MVLRYFIALSRYGSFAPIEIPEKLGDDDAGGAIGRVLVAEQNIEDVDGVIDPEHFPQLVQAGFAPAQDLETVARPDRVRRRSGFRRILGRACRPVLRSARSSLWLP